MADPVIREFLLTFWKIHILHHAEQQGIYGQWMIDELRRHGYQLSPGTLYPVLARMAQRGWLRPSEPASAHQPRVYRITRAGAAVLTRLRGLLGELQREVAPARSPRARPKTRTSVARPQTTRRGRL
jgi:PadR family transcriptional regulator, regulatory protein PadR